MNYVAVAFLIAEISLVAIILDPFIPNDLRTLAFGALAGSILSRVALPTTPAAAA